jgi:hypothetical protein
MSAVSRSCKIHSVVDAKAPAINFARRFEIVVTAPPGLHGAWERQTVQGCL